MPSSSRRCGMITRREAERLVNSFLETTKPLNLPENFVFEVYHHCAWGCRGLFIPIRYNSSRAKCIRSIEHCNGKSHVFFLSLILDVHFAIVSFHRINSSFILIVYRMYPMYNRIVLISMLGVVIYDCTIQHTVKNYEMHGKMSRQCSMEVIENDQPRQVCPNHRP